MSEKSMPLTVPRYLEMEAEIELLKAEIERLRQEVAHWKSAASGLASEQRIADAALDETMLLRTEIERLREERDAAQEGWDVFVARMYGAEAESERLREALETIADPENHTSEARRIARAALEGSR